MGFGKIYTYVTAVYVNCKDSHQATSGKCPTREKAEKDARKKKGGKAIEKIKEIAAKQDKFVEGAITEEIEGENANLELREKSADEPCISTLYTTRRKPSKGYSLNHFKVKRRKRTTWGAIGR